MKKIEYTINDQLKALRIINGIRQTELSKVLDVTQGYVSKIESNQMLPDIEYMIKLANFFDISLDHFKIGRFYNISNGSNLKKLVNQAYLKNGYIFIDTIFRIAKVADSSISTKINNNINKLLYFFPKVQVNELFIIDLLEKLTPTEVKSFQSLIKQELFKEHITDTKVPFMQIGQFIDQLPNLKAKTIEPNKNGIHFSLNFNDKYEAQSLEILLNIIILEVKIAFKVNIDPVSTSINIENEKVKMYLKA